MNCNDNIKYCIGIDFGTTYCCIGLYDLDNNNITMIPDIMNNNKTIISSDINGIFNVKRLLGKKYSKINNKLNQLYYEIKGDNNDDILIKYDSNNYKTPIDISTLIIKKLQTIIEKYIGSENMNMISNEIVITVPAYFNNKQRECVKKATENTGYIISKIINEPTSASIAYGLDRNINENILSKNNKILVFDLGGGTLDISILEIDLEIYDNKNLNNFTVLATNGDNNLGGEDFTNKLKYFVMYDFANKYILNLDNIKHLFDIKIQNNLLGYILDDNINIDDIKKIINNYLN